MSSLPAAIDLVTQSNHYTHRFCGHFAGTCSFAVHSSSLSLWDYNSDTYVHRVVDACGNLDKSTTASTNTARNGTVDVDGKNTMLAVEYYNLLDHQLANQAAYFAAKTARLETESATGELALTLHCTTIAARVDALELELQSWRVEQRACELRYSQLSVQLGKQLAELRTSKQKNASLLSVLHSNLTLSLCGSIIRPVSDLTRPRCNVSRWPMSPSLRRLPWLNNLQMLL